MSLRCVKFILLYTFGFFCVLEGISQNLSSVTNDSFCYKLLKSLLLIGYQGICHRFFFCHLSLKKGFVKRVPGCVFICQYNLPIMYRSQSFWLQIAGSVVCMYGLSPKLTGVLLITLPIIVLAGAAIGAVLRKLARDAQEQVTSLYFTTYPSKKWPLLIQSIGSRGVIVKL